MGEEKGEASRVNKRGMNLHFQIPGLISFIRVFGSTFLLEMVC
jgi:hypothetical protein